MTILNFEKKKKILCTITSFTGNDLSRSPPRNVKLPGGNEVVKITLGTKRDILIEENESFDVIAYPPSDANIHCRTTVTIIDDSKLCCVYTRYGLIC